LTVLLQIEVESEKPIYVQIHDQIVEGIARGELRPGQSLPSIRQLAADFGINLHTVNKAYDVLEREGFIVLRRKTGAVIQITPGLPSDWEERQRTILAEAIAKSVKPDEIIRRAQQILDEFLLQRQQDTNSYEWSEEQ
jgi:DNA-binding transcriptional regulator YhcF (GntR family)